MPAALCMSEVAGNPLWDPGKQGVDDVFHHESVLFNMRSTETGLCRDRRDFISCSHFSQNITLSRRLLSLFVCLLRAGVATSEACSVVEILGNRRQQGKKHSNNMHKQRCPAFSVLDTLPACLSSTAVPYPAPSCPALAHTFQISLPKVSFLWLMCVLSHLRGTADA